MAAGNNGNFGDDIKFNVDVAKQMTVPDEIKLTGPSDGQEEHQSQSFTTQMVVPDDITFTTTLRPKDDSHRESAVPRSSVVQSNNAVSSIVRASTNLQQKEDQVDKLADIESRLAALDTRVARIENRYPFATTERNVLNTLIFVTWLSLPVFYLYFYHKYWRN